MRFTALLNHDSEPALQWMEVASSLQIPAFHIIGLASQEVSEARERIRAAIEASGLEFPRRRVVLNLSPASVRKRGTGSDLAMALAVLASSESGESGESDEADAESDTAVLACGELGLDGTLKGSGQATRALYAAWKAGVPWVLLALEDLPAAAEALRLLQAAGGLKGPAPRVIGVANVREAWAAARNSRAEPKREFVSTPVLEVATGKSECAPTPPADPARTGSHSEYPLLPLAPFLERAAGAAALGRHHLLLLGPRGTGKSHALEWLIALQAPITPRLRLERVLLEELAESDCGHRRSPGRDSTDARQAPARRISPSCHPAALIGGVSDAQVRPGEFSLAHGGLLLADEFPEWHRDAREALREPLERGRITLTRAQRSAELPARFMLAANGNLCPCGGWPPSLAYPAGGHGIVPCHCSVGARETYLRRLSGPILDRMDLVVLLGAPPRERLRGGETTAERLALLRARVLAGQRRAEELWGTVPGRLPPSSVEALLADNPAWQEEVERARCSLRGRHKLLRVALSLALWDGADRPTAAHFTEARFFRADSLFSAAAS